MTSLLRSREEYQAKRTLTRALERELRVRELPFTVAFVEVHAEGGRCRARLEVPLQHGGVPQPPEVVARHWADALADLSVDRGTFGLRVRRGQPSAPVALARVGASIRFELARELRERGLPFEAASCAMCPDGTSFGVADVYFEHEGERPPPEELAGLWVGRLVEQCGGANGKSEP